MSFWTTIKNSFARIRISTIVLNNSENIEAING
jgi:hypothetical protein